ncbi:MAG: penicillin-binding protein 2 [Cellvibrionaceae bacterium]|nr:penicillin-binding protein 2 [Cellvibrionaceae bacterium]
MRTRAQVYPWRYYCVLLLFIVASIGLFAHLSFIQVVPDVARGYQFLQQQGTARTLRTEVIPGMRGVIADRHGEPLAVSTPVVSLWANPAELLAEKSRWAALARALSTDTASLEQKLERYANKEFMYLQRRLDPSDAEKILSLNIAGVYGQQEYRRFYPAGEVTAHLLGFTNIDDRGQEGIELAYDEWLTGVDGRKQVLKDLRGRVIKDVNLIQSMEAGKNLSLSIDLRLQYLAYRELKAAVKAHNAKAGSVVLLDIQNGEVLAMANQPSFNPNDRSRLSIGATRNRAMTDQFEPGSTMKPLTVMAALETGRFKETTRIDTNPGYLRVGNKTLLDPINYGIVDVAKILQKSSQVGLTKISLGLDGDAIRDMFFRVGLGQDTGTGFPGEAVGVLPEYTKWKPIVQANFSFGYGLTLTPLQLAQAYSVIADRGLKKPVSILKRQQPVVGKAVVAADIAQQVATMLQKVVEPGGTGTRAHLDGYAAAGKTGTIHKIGRSGYADDRYLSLFAGFAPADKPRVVAVIVIDEPRQGQYFGGEVAAPVFSQLVDRSLRILQVPPQLVNADQFDEKKALDKRALGKNIHPNTHPNTHPNNSRVGPLS